MLFPVIWAVFCIPLLALMTLLGLGSKIPVTMLYTIFLSLCYLDLRRNEKFFQLLRMNNNKWRWRSFSIASLSTVSILIISICHGYGALWNLHIDVTSIPCWLGVFYPAAGAPIALVMWFYVACRINERDRRFHLLSKIEFYTMLVITYALSLSIDYSNLIVGRAPGLHS